MMAVSVNTTGDQLSIGTPQVLFEESALAWSGADRLRYDVTADGQRFITVKPDPREEAAAAARRHPAVRARNAGAPHGPAVTRDPAALQPELLSC